MHIWVYMTIYMVPLLGKNEFVPKLLDANTEEDGDTIIFKDYCYFIFLFFHGQVFSQLIMHS